MGAFFNDVKYSVRMFVKTPGFTVTAVAALAVGIGATTAIFSLVNTVLLKPLRIPEPDRLVVLSTSGPDGSAASPAKFVNWRSESNVFRDVSAYLQGVINYTGGQIVEEWRYTRASADTFRCFGIPILRGRTFIQQEELPNGPPVAVISESLWKRRFASDPKILGAAISLNGELHTVIGIAADVPALSDYATDYATDVYVPLQLDPNTRDQGDYLEVVARLRTGITLEQARARLQISTVEYRAKFPNALGQKETFTAKRYREDLVGGDRPMLLLLLSAVSLVLLIACSNVANLLLVRATGRRREIAIRAAIGAGRGRIIRQLLTESALLSLVGGGLGLFLGYGGIRALLVVNTAGLPLVGKSGTEVSIDWRVMGFALFVSFVTGIVFGLFPALAASRGVDVNAILKAGSGSSGTGPRQNRARALFVISEVSLAAVLLVSSALLIRSFAALYVVDPGFETKNVVTLNVLLAGRTYSKSADTIRRGLEDLRAIPGVVAAGATCCEPLAQGEYDMNFDIVGQESTRSSVQDVGWATVSPGYFEVLRIPVKRGRPFTYRDDNKSVPVVVVNERLAKEYWNNGDALGAEIVIGRGAPEFKDEPVRRIVGIVGDTRSDALDTKPRPIMYVPQAQVTEVENAFFLRLLPIVWMVRTQGEPLRLIPSIREQLWATTGLPVTDIAPMDQMLWAQTGRQRFNVLLMTAFGGAALLLAAIGIYGMMAYTVQQRRQEIGIRLALGAESKDVKNMVVRQGMSLALTGVLIGMGAAWGLTRPLATFLYGIKPHDVLVFAAAPVVLIVVALVAVYLPATRAGRVNPIEALRHD
jgi:putative ABC transport system permease protein